MADLGNEFSVNFQLPDLRNGTVGNIVAIVPSTAIPRQYHWFAISGLPEDRRIAFTEIVCRAHFTILRAIDTTMSADLARKQAIVLGGIRTGMAVFWKIAGGDVSPGEILPGYVTYRAHAAAIVGDAAAVPPVAAQPAVAEGVNTAFGGGTAAAAGAAWGAWTAMTDDEITIARAHIVLGSAIVPTQGWSIVKNGHHYLSNAGAGAKSAYTSILKQWKSKFGAVVAAWVDSNSAWWDDIAFHKAGHPIKMDLKVQIAGNPETPLKLKAADFGSAAVRLPATVPEFEYAKLVSAMLEKVSGTLAGIGATVTTATLTAAINDVIAETDPAAKARKVTHAVQLAHSQDPSLAVAAGVLIYLTEDQTGNTITKSYGFRRLVAEYPAEVTMGRNMARANMQSVRDRLASGTPVALNIAL